jgi:hypothetical protein
MFPTIGVREANAEQRTLSVTTPSPAPAAMTRWRIAPNASSLDTLRMKWSNRPRARALGYLNAGSLERVQDGVGRHLDEGVTHLILFHVKQDVCLEDLFVEGKELVQIGRQSCQMIIPVQGCHSLAFDPYGRCK